jgi:predicted DNA-binding transcriptional regulator YafY
MGSANLAREKIARLLRILLGLRTLGTPDARRLAEFCEVSRRTIYRDLATLNEAGLVVTFDPERAGYVLHTSTRLDPPAMTIEEVEGLALLVLAGTAQAALGRREAARRALSRLADALPERDREHLGRLIDRVESVRDRTPDSSRNATWDLLLTALIESRRVRIETHDPSDPVGCLVTLLSPYRLVRDDHAWRILGRSSLHRDVRAFLIDEIRRASLTDEVFTVPTQAATCASPRKRQPTRVRILHRPLAPTSEAPTTPGSLVGCIRLRNGWFEIDFEIPSHPEAIDQLVGWVLAAAGRVEIVDPPLLRERVHQLAERVARTHALQAIETTTSVPG